jgi:hypothetical protein
MGTSHWKLTAALIGLSALPLASCSSTESLKAQNAPTPTPTGLTYQVPPSRTPTAEEVQRQQEQEYQRHLLQQQELERETKAAATRYDPMTYTRFQPDCFRLPSCGSGFESHDYNLFLKNPDERRGQKAVLFGLVTQFDSRTGDSTFRADVSNFPHLETAQKQSPPYTVWHVNEDSAYTDNAIIEARDPSMLANIAQGDFVRMFVEVAGTANYESTIGIKQTVPVFIVNMIGSCPAGGPVDTSVLNTGGLTMHEKLTCTVGS